MSNGIKIGFLAIVVMALGYFTYGNTISGALGILLLVIGTELTILLSLIPFVGMLFAYIVNTTYTYPVIMGFTGITETWLTTVILTIYTILSVIITGATTAFILNWK